MEFGWYTAESWARLLVVAGLDLVWQSMLLAGVVAGILSCGRLAASARFLAWWVVLAFLPFMALFNSLDWQQRFDPAVAVFSGAALRVRAVPETAAVVAPTSMPLQESGIFPIRLPPGRWPLWLIGGWAGVVGLGLIRLLAAYYSMRKLKGQAVPLSDVLVRRGEYWRRRLGLRREVYWGGMHQAETPVAAGLWRPCVLLPLGQVDTLTKDALDQVLIHELAHLRRRDDWLQLLQQALALCLFFVPAVRWITSRIELERETCCDEWVITLKGDRRGYATMLVDMLEHGTNRTLSPAVAGVLGGVPLMRRRLQRILVAERAGPSRWAWGAVIAGIGTAGACLAGPYWAMGGSPLAPGSVSGGPLLVLAHLEQALEGRDLERYVSLLDRDFLFIEADCSGTPLFYTRRRDEVRMLGGQEGVFKRADAVGFDFELERFYREKGRDFPKAYAGDPDGHPQEDWQVLSGQASWVVKTVSGQQHSWRQDVTLKLRQVEQDWRIVRWGDAPLGCGASDEIALVSRPAKWIP
jgi:Zn-dependent protease with chaperone function